MRIARLVRRLVVGLLVLLVAAAGLIHVVSEHKLSTTYDVPASRVGVPTESEAVARGEHLVRVTATCTLCHGEDLGGLIYADLGAIGRIVGPNLTQGRGGVGRSFTTDDWVRAIRYGVREDGTSLIVMPSEVFTNMTDADLGSVIAFLLRLPPVDRELPATRFGPLGRVLLAIGRLDLLVAPKTRRPEADVVVRAEETAEYGRYLADISGCHGCHGPFLSGGRVAGPPGLPPAANLTPEALGGWSAEDFARAMRDGRRPDGRELDDFMPWRQFAGMTDTELGALWRYLQSVPPRATGNK